MRAVTTLPLQNMGKFVYKPLCRSADVLCSSIFFPVDSCPVPVTGRVLAATGDKRTRKESHTHCNNVILLAIGQ